MPQLFAFQMISLNSLFGVILIYCMLNGVRCQCQGEIILNILTMQSTTKDDIEEITIDGHNDRGVAREI
jgi:hypothetical protein